MLHRNSHFVNVAKRAHGQCSIFSMVQYFCPDYTGFYWSYRYELLLRSLILYTLGYNYSTVPRIHGSKQTKSEGIDQGEGC